MSRTIHGAARLALGVALTGALTGALAGCGGFGSDPGPAPGTTIDSYVALGDGFTAAPYTGHTTKDDGCLRSKADYPALVAEDLDVEEFTDVSCTHATTKALTSGQKPGRGTRSVDAQLDAVDRGTDLVTVGIGIEDGDLLDRLFEVCTTNPCRPGTTPIRTLLDDSARAAANVTAALRDAQDRAPQAYFVVVGYPRIAPTSGSCRDLPKLEQLGLDAANYLVDDLNRQLRSSARQTGAAFVDVAALSAGHELCSDEPWIRGTQDRPGKAVALHPVAAEQRAVAAELAALVRQR